MAVDGSSRVEAKENPDSDHIRALQGCLEWPWGSSPSTERQTLSLFLMEMCLHLFWLLLWLCRLRSEIALSFGKLSSFFLSPFLPRLTWSCWQFSSTGESPRQLTGCDSHSPARFPPPALPSPPPPSSHNHNRTHLPRRTPNHFPFSLKLVLPSGFSHLVYIAPPCC